MSELVILGLAVVFMLPKLADAIMPHVPATLLALVALRESRNHAGRSHGDRSVLSGAFENRRPEDSNRPFT